MSARTRLVSLDLEAFRGFAAPATLGLDADIVLVRGDNGTGKTCLVDAILWLFTGQIPRLADRAKGLRKGHDPIVNRYRSGHPARVRLQVRLPDRRLLEFEREGDGNGSQLRATEAERILDLVDATAQAFGGATPPEVAQAVGSWGILQQHALLAALDAGATMHQRLAEVVGLDRVTRFATSAQEVARALARERKQAEGVLESLRHHRSDSAGRLADARSHAVAHADPSERMRASLAELQAALPDGISIRRFPTVLDELAALGRETADVLETLSQVTAAEGELEAARAGATEAVGDVEAELNALLDRANAERAKAPVATVMAGAALELLSDTCPVCGQPIDPASVREHLTELIRQSAEQASLAEETARAIRQAQTRLEAARVADQHRQSREDRRDQALAQFSKKLDEGPWLVVDPGWRARERRPELEAQLMRLQELLRQAYLEAQRTSGEQIARLSAEVEAAEAEISRAVREVQELTDRAARAAQLDKAAHRAAERIVARALKRLEPSFAEVFDRLSPHPTFTQLRATQDIFYGKNQVVPEVYDPERDVDGNPSLIFSEGQLNVVALSYFLGLALNAGDPALPFVVLDDPLQSMDVLGVLGFADLCRRLRAQRQLLITTHDRRFAALLARKLAPRERGTSTLVHELENWTEDGPSVRTIEEPLAEIVGLLERRAS